MNALLEQPEFDFEYELPAGKQWFSVSWLAKHWDVSERTVKRLVEDGTLRKTIDLAPGASKHALTRIARETLVKFLGDRSNLRHLDAMRLARRRSQRK
jgi:hypothetical protein